MEKRGILLLGVPGSGKGTQAKLLKNYGFIQISPGEIIRKAIDKKDKKIISYKREVESGELIPDRIIFDLLEENMRNKDRNYILDGAVRDIKQAKELVKRKLFDKTVFFSLSEEEAKKRLIGRAKKERRKDDSPEIILNRFKEYKDKTKPILDYLKQTSEFHEIDASASIKKIHDEVLRVLKLKK